MFGFKDLNKKEKILYCFILLFLITLFIGQLRGINVGVMGALVVYSFSLSSLREKWEALKARKPVQGFVLFFLLLCISCFLSEDLQNGFHNLKIRLPLLLFPVSLGLIPVSKKLKDNVLLSFAVLTTLLCGACFVFSIYRSGFFREPAFLYNDSLTYLIRQQSIYMALVVNFAVYVFAYFIFFRQGQKKGLMLLAVFFLYLTSYLLASRIMLALLVVTTLGFSFYYTLSKRKYLEGATLVLGLIMGIAIIHKLMPNTFNRYKELTYTSFDFASQGKESHYNMAITPDQWNGANFRLAAWACGWEVFQTSPVKGVDLGDKDAVLVAKYLEKKFLFAIRTEKNVHSNYLDVLFSMGVIGLVVCLFSWLVLPLRFAWRFKDGVAFLMIVTFAIAWTTEVYFGRNFGTMLLGFFFALMLTDKPSVTQHPSLVVES